MIVFSIVFFKPSPRFTVIVEAAGKACRGPTNQLAFSELPFALTGDATAEPKF